MDALNPFLLKNEENLTPSLSLRQGTEKDRPFLGVPVCSLNVT